MTDQPQLPPEPPPTPELPPPTASSPPPAPQSQGIPTQAPQPDRLQSEARLWAMLTHLTALSGFIGVPFGHLLGPLIVWLVKKDQIPLVDDQGKESLNFQLSMTIYGLVAALLMVVFIGFVLLGALIILDIVLVIIASVEANKGNLYRYPITIRFLK
jgi:uncharacterized Tic20 family protein